MKKKFLLYSIAALLLCIGIYAYSILNETGFFRTIENQLDGEVVATIDLAGAEDMTVSLDGEFLIISSDDRAYTRDSSKEKGGIYWMNLKDETFKLEALSNETHPKMAPHGIDLWQIDSSHYRLFVINHHLKKHTIEVFDLYHNHNDSLNLVHDTTYNDVSIFSPNDIVAMSADAFYFTNDKSYSGKWGKFQAEYLGKKGCSVIYFDGKKFRQVAENFAYANGIRYDFDRELLFVAEARGFLINVFKRESNGDLTLIEKIPTGTGVDNIEFDTNGHLWIGCHPSLLAYSAFSDGKKPFAPSEIIKIAYNGKGDYTQETIFLDDGQLVSGMSAAPVFKNFVFTGNVMDDHVLVLKLRQD
jgi:arylesterase/paraoxonase